MKNAELRNRLLSITNEVKALLTLTSVSELNDIDLNLAHVEHRCISVALSIHKTSGDAAKALGISRQTLIRKARKYGIKI